MSRPETSLVVLLTFFILPFIAEARAEQDNRPNILLLLSDDHHHTALGCAGDPAIQTPHLDRLAREGVRFTHAFVPNPICTPARAALFTGQDNWTNGCYFFGKPIRATSPLWPRLLADNGYETFFTGKWDNDGRPSERGFTIGGKIWLGGDYDHAHLPVLSYGQSKKHRKRGEKYSSTLFVDSAVDFLEKRDTAKPFAMLVSFTGPHDPWNPPDPYASMYTEADMPVPANFSSQAAFRTNEKFPQLRDQRQLPYPRTKADVRQALTQYYAMITQMDAEIGRILIALEKQNLADNTLVIFVGDHGYSMGSHGFVGKQTMYEEGIRTPLVIRYPKLMRGSEANESLVSLIDLFPTIVRAAGIPVPDVVEGSSLLGLYQDQEKEIRNEVFAAFHSPTAHRMVTRCIRTREHKLIQHLLTEEVELFDLSADPFELNNLANKPELAAVQSSLNKRLMQWREQAEKNIDLEDRLQSN